MKNKFLILLLLGNVLYSKTLLEYYDIAFKNSYAIKEAKYNLEDAKYKVEQIKSQNGVNLAWDISYSRHKYIPDEQGYNSLYNEKQFDLKFDKVLYNIANNTDIQKSIINWRQEKLKYIKSLQKFNIDFINKYFQVYQSQKQYELSIKNQRFAKKIYQKAQQQLKLNLINRSDYLKVKINFLESNNSLEIYKQQLQNSKDIFKTILGDIDLDNFVALNINSLELLKKYDINNSKNIDSMILDLDILSLSQDLHKINHWYYPKLDFSLNYNVSRSGREIATEDITTKQLIGKLILSGNLYKGGYTNSSKSRILAQLNSKKNANNDLKRTLDIELRNSKLQLQDLIFRFKITTQKIEQSKLEFKMIQRKNTMGLIDVSELLKHQRELYNLEGERLDYIIKSIKLFLDIQYNYSLDTRKSIEIINNLIFVD